MLGNSSSGLIEAALFGCPVINVGNRQAGRQRPANVIDIPSDRTAVAAAISTWPPRKAVKNPYGDGHAAPRIADFLFSMQNHADLLNKLFADISQPIGSGARTNP